MIRLPKRIFLFCMITAWLVPFLARIPGVPMRGWAWVTDYLPGIFGILFTTSFNAFPGLMLYGLGKASTRTPLAFWCAASTGTGFLLWAHGVLNLRSSSTAAIALVFIPIYAAGAVIAGWLIGLMLNKVVRAEQGRILIAGIAGATAVFTGAGLAVHDSISISKRESRFPVVSVNQIPFSKRSVFSQDSVGNVKVLALANFDAEPGKEIGVLGRSGLALLQPETYGVKSVSAFTQEDCKGCVHMYPYLVPDGKGGLLVTSSDGLSDSRGHLLWRLNAVGFTRLVPIHLADQGPSFFSYQGSEQIDRHDIDGKVLWSAKLRVFDVGIYVTPEGKELPFALAYHEKSSQFNLYGLDGKSSKIIDLPKWASSISAIAWPERGNLLVGNGDRLGVLDSQGKVIFRHTVKNTSFNPYHGPDGTAVRFDPSQAPYLAVMCHGSSGYPRSVLLIFDPNGRLAWQEELNKLHSILAVPAGSKGEVLLVGGRDGVIEYRLGNATALKQ